MIGRFERGFAAVAMVLACAAAPAEPVRIVAAESVYGGIARQVGGAHVAVTSVLERPDQDPHEFEAGAGAARAVAGAALVIYNGAGYDSWMAKLLAASRSPSREVVEVAALARTKPGDNPHLWYRVDTVSAVAATIADRLARIDPSHRADYASGAAAFDASLASLRERIAAMRARYAGTPVTATEPVFQYIADALGLDVRNARFQISVMNGTEPGARTIAAFESDLRNRRVKALVVNTQSGEAIAKRMRAIAERSGVPVVSVTETQPAGRTYAQWMLSQLDALERALAAP